MTIREAIAAAISRLASAGVDTPRLDAELLLAHVLGEHRTYLFAHPKRELTVSEGESFEQLLARRQKREPLPYLLGRWEFMGLLFLVSPAVLIPRPETETLVEAVAQRLPRAARILDVGAGSGCISIALTRLLPEAEIIALEPSPAAAAMARRNCEALGVSDRVRVVRGSFPKDVLHPSDPLTSRSPTSHHPPRPTSHGPRLTAHSPRPTLHDLDAVVSNPPYIPSAGIVALEPELREYEPRQALDGGPDGLTVLRALARESAVLLKPGGLLALEVAMGQAEEVESLLREAGHWTPATAVPDLAGIPRVVLTRAKIFSVR